MSDWSAKLQADFEALVTHCSTLSHWFAADGARDRSGCLRGTVALQDALKAGLAEGVATWSPHCVPRKLKAQRANRIIIVLHLPCGDRRHQNAKLEWG